MKNRITSISAIVLCLLASQAHATEDQKAAPVSTKAKPVAEAKGQAGKLGKQGAELAAEAKAKKVNINAASAEELMKLPGIDEEIAKKIIAKRPFNTKATLVTDNILGMGAYQEIRTQIDAGFPPKDAKQAGKPATAKK